MGVNLESKLESKLGSTRRSALAWMLVLLLVTSCGLNPNKGNSDNKISKQNTLTGVTDQNTNLKAKKKKVNPNRSSVKNESVNNILVTDLGSNQSDEDVGYNKISKIELKCQYKDQCAKLIQDKIIKLWQFRRSYPKFKTILVLELSNEGYITTIRLKRSSGRRAFDDSVIKAVRQAAPFKAIQYLPEYDITEFSSIELVFKR